MEFMTFPEFLKKEGIENPNQDYLARQAEVIKDFMMRGIDALDSRASDSTCHYCLLVKSGFRR